MGNSRVFMLLFLLILSCKKPENYTPSEPVKYEPLPYFPIYPGSSWDYVDSSSNIIRYSCEPKYELVRINYTDSIVLDPILLPKYQGNYFLGYKVLNQTSNGDIFRAFFSEELNKEFITNSWGVYHHIEYQNTTITKVKAVNKTMIHPYLGAVDSIIIIDKLTTNIQIGNNFTKHEIDYYAKNIGVIRNSLINDSIGDTTIIIDLKSYFINH